MNEILRLAFASMAILHKNLKLPGSLHGSLQILRVYPFEKIALHEMLMKNEFRKPEIVNINKYGVI